MNNKAFIAKLEHFRVAVLAVKMLLRLKEARPSLRPSQKTLAKKLQLNRLTLIVVVDLPGTQPKMYEMSSGKGWHRVRR